jgi:TPP-dependent pyruvate/acetoin dehydrogenase alpha subunit
MPLSEPDRSTLIEIYRRMTLIKQNDERIVSCIKGGELGIYYSPRGQEVVAAAMGVHLRAEDYIVTIYRGVHDHIAKGIPLKKLWAEYGGKATGTCKGKGGPMHITHPETGVMVTTGIVGAGIPIANGLALASKMRADGRVTVTNFGDGATNIGAFHEALNLASLWKLPVVFLCQNNRYAEHTPFAKGTAAESIASRAAAYNMPGIRVNGNDPIEMWKASHEAVDRARKGGGPTLIEAMTFRFRGHHFGDDGHYIPAEEYEEAVRNDPVPNFRNWLITREYATDGQLRDMEANIERQIDEAVEYMRASPYPALHELQLDVYESAIQP